MNCAIYDTLILGSGPAGMTAAIYLARANKLVELVDKDGYGGNISKTPFVNNIPGFIGSGDEFATNMYVSQICDYQNLNHSVRRAVLVEYKHGLFLTHFSDRTSIASKTLLFATGSTPRQINVTTNSLHYCVTCDGPFYKGKDVIVVGSANTGLTYALELSTYCNKVYLCDLTSSICGEEALKKKVKETSNIIWMPNTTIKSAINKDNLELESVELTTGEILKCDGIFAAIGFTPNTELAKSFFALDESGYIIAPETESQSIAGLYAAGDCRQGTTKQVVSACADGAEAALKIIKYLNK